MPKYSATVVSHSFWFSEFQQYVALINEGVSISDIRERATHENYFKQSTMARNQDLLNALRQRLATLDQDYLKLFPMLDIANQKLVNLMSIMNTNRLFAEFMYEVYRDELILGDAQLHDYEVEAFFDRKKVENQQIAEWKEETIERLSSLFKTFVREAGLMQDKGKYDQIERPMLDLQLEDLLRDKADNQALSVFLGR